MPVSMGAETGGFKGVVPCRAACATRRNQEPPHPPSAPSPKGRRKSWERALGTGDSRFGKSRVKNSHLPVGHPRLHAYGYPAGRRKSWERALGTGDSRFGKSRVKNPCLPAAPSPSCPVGMQGGYRTAFTHPRSRLSTAGWLVTPIPVLQALLLCARMARCLSRCQSFSLSVLRLSCSCLPRARPISILTLLPFQYMAIGTIV